jgi:hypothetical protein
MANPSLSIILHGAVNAGVYGGSVMLIMEIDSEDRVKKRQQGDTHKWT